MSLLPENAVLFGRQADLEFLRKRIQKKGLTVLAGPPQIGKSWLVRTLCQSLLDNGNGLIGYYPSTSNFDAISGSVRDLYSRWLEKASYSAQLRSLISRNNKNKGNVATRVGDMLSTALGSPITPLGELVAKMFKNLADVENDLRTGGILLPAVPYDKLIESVNLISNLSERENLPVVLVLDQWEQIQNPDTDRVTIGNLLKSTFEWPKSLHIIVVIRKEPQYDRILQICSELCEYKALAEHYELEQMQYTGNETADLVNYIHRKFPFSENMDPESILKLIDGNPGVIGWWIDGKPESAEQLESQAEDAHRFRFTEVGAILTGLLNQNLPLFAVAGRLALLSEIGDKETWAILREIVLKEKPANSLVALESLGLLKQSEPPSFGHRKRYESVRYWYQTKPRAVPYSSETAKYLVREMAPMVTDISDENVSLITNLASLKPVLEDFGLSRSVFSLPCFISLSLSDLAITNEEEDLILDWPKALEEIPGSQALISMGLFNTLYHAKQEEKLDRRDSLLQELRELHARFPDDPEVRENLAIGLYNSLNYAKQEEKLELRDALLQELRDLHNRYPDDPEVRKPLAMGLNNTLNDAKQEANLELRDALLQELRDLHNRYPDDPEVRKPLAKGLYNTLNDAKQEDNLKLRDALLQELRDLHNRYPDDPEVRKPLAMGLYNTLNDAKQEDNLKLRDALLQELRDLHNRYPDDPEVRKPLAMGLYNTLNHAKQEDNLKLRDALLQELRDLHNRYPDDPEVRKPLAMGLYNTLNDAKQEDNLKLRDALLQELRDLHNRYPDDPEVRKPLAMGLYNTLNHAKQEDNLKLRDALLQELRDLHNRYPDDPEVRENLAIGLYNSLNYAKQEEKLELRDALLQELRDLHNRYPDDPEVRKPLAMGLNNTLNDAKQEANLELRDALLQELRDLHNRYPDDPEVRKPLAKGLYNTLNDAKQEDNLKLRDALLQELRDLHNRYPDDPEVRKPLAMGLNNTLNDAKQEANLELRDALLQELRDLHNRYPDDPEESNTG